MTKKEIKDLIALKERAVQKETEKMNKIKERIKAYKSFISVQKKALEEAEVKELLVTLKQNNIPPCEYDTLVKAYLHQFRKSEPEELKNEADIS